jgi:putative ABC transport system permease protein
VALCTLFPAWRAGRVSAIRTLETQGDADVKGVSRLAGLAARLRLPMVVVVGLKDMWRRPGRTSLTTLALILAVITATFSVGIEATFKAIMSDHAMIGGPPYDIIADRDLVPDSEARRILDSHPEVKSYLAVYSLDGRVNHTGVDVMGAEGDLNNPRWAVRQGRMPEHAGEAAISTSLAAEQGLAVGGSVTVVIEDVDDPVTLTIVGRYADIEGRVVAMTRDSLPADFEPSDYAITTVSGTDNRALADALIAGSGGNLDPQVLDQTLADIRNEWRPVIYGLNAVLLFIAGVNLLSSLLLNIRERRRDFAILKTVGFTPSQIAQAVFVGSVALAGFAIVTGIPLGLFATRLMLDILASAAQIETGINVSPSALWLAPLIPGAIGLAALATVLPARRAAAVEVAEALRYE